MYAGWAVLEFSHYFANYWWYLVIRLTVVQVVVILVPAAVVEVTTDKTLLMITVVELVLVVILVVILAVIQTCLTSVILPIYIGHLAIRSKYRIQIPCYMCIQDTIRYCFSSTFPCCLAFCTFYLDLIVQLVQSHVIRVSLSGCMQVTCAKFRRTETFCCTP